MENLIVTLWFKGLEGLGTSRRQHILRSLVAPDKQGPADIYVYTPEHGLRPDSYMFSNTMYTTFVMCGSFSDVLHVLNNHAQLKTCVSPRRNNVFYSGGIASETTTIHSSVCHLRIHIISMQLICTWLRCFFRKKKRRDSTAISQSSCMILKFRPNVTAGILSVMHAHELLNLAIE